MKLFCFRKYMPYANNVKLVIKYEDEDDIEIYNLDKNNNYYWNSNVEIFDEKLFKYYYLIDESFICHDYISIFIYESKSLLQIKNIQNRSNKEFEIPKLKKFYLCKGISAYGYPLCTVNTFNDRDYIVGMWGKFIDLRKKCLLTIIVLYNSKICFLKQSILENSTRFTFKIGLDSLAFSGIYHILILFNDKIVCDEEFLYNKFCIYDNLGYPKYGEMYIK